MKSRSLLLACLFLLPACSLQERISATSSRIEQQYAEIKNWEDMPQRTISWNQAVAMMKRNNLEYLRTQQAIETAERNEMSVYTDSIPGVSYYGYFNESISTLTKQINKVDINQNINVSFYLPSLTRLPYNVYSAKATVFANKKAQEGTERELVSKLYAMQRKYEIQNRKNALDKQNPEKKPDYLVVSKIEEDNDRWNEIAKLLGDYSARWVILPSSIPQFKWSNYRKLTGKLDDLVVCQFAMGLEQARLQQYGVALSYLPTLNTSLYSPSLFTSTGGTYSGTFLDKDDTRLNFSASYTFDTDLKNWYRYCDNKEAYELKQRETSQKLVELKQKLHSLRSSMDEYYSWRSFMQKRLEYLRTAQAENAEEFLENEKTIHSMERELLQQEETAVESEAALILQYGLRA